MSDAFLIKQIEKQNRMLRNILKELKQKVARIEASIEDGEATIINMIKERKAKR